MFVCPACKKKLERYNCGNCGIEYPEIDGIPNFLGGVKGLNSVAVANVYDEIYAAHENVWEDQGRDEKFRIYISTLTENIAPGSLLEIGCGEGLLLKALNSSKKYGIDPSTEALKRAKARSGAECAVALAECLPFGDAEFDAVLAVGVMEHFSDPKAATAEIFRVLKPGGAFITLIHTDQKLFERLTQKIREFLIPNFRPIAAIRWIKKKVVNPIRQPMRKSYTAESAMDLLAAQALPVEKIFSKKSDPRAPFAGNHALLLVARKK